MELGNKISSLVNETVVLFHFIIMKFWDLLIVTQCMPLGFGGHTDTSYNLLQSLVLISHLQIILCLENSVSRKENAHWRKPRCCNIYKEANWRRLQCHRALAVFLCEAYMQMTIVFAGRRWWLSEWLVAERNPGQHGWDALLSKIHAPGEHNSNF